MHVLLINHDADTRMAMRLLLEAMDQELFLHEFGMWECGGAHPSSATHTKKPRRNHRLGA